ncbi:hypothetical protein [Serratia marcescens]|uniref:Uncharacterized protein n=1 Tax=Serratia marcescens TaxID=615 RepID=A0A9X8YS57_SERMA|nr:hypothetical protein [Serratia marcescens]MBS3894874.1 hypothetical protein [Serratia marcescens]
MSNKYTEFNIASDYPFESRLHRLIMICIQISGSGDGGDEKRITDKRLKEFCCCNSADLITAMNFLVEQGFIAKRNFGYQFGLPSSGYTITVPDHLRALR